MRSRELGAGLPTKRPWRNPKDANLVGNNQVAEGRTLCDSPPSPSSSLTVAAGEGISTGLHGRAARGALCALPGGRIGVWVGVVRACEHIGGCKGEQAHRQDKLMLAYRVMVGCTSV